MASAETWAKRVSAWRASGKTADEFAAGRGFAGGTLRWWASRLGRRSPDFVRVVSAAPPPSSTAACSASSTLELEVRGVIVRVRSGFDRGLLGEVLDVLGARASA